MSVLCRPTDDDGNQTGSVRTAAEDYRRTGVAVCRIPVGEKTPKDKGWPTRSAEPVDFQDGDNIGLVCGYPSRRQTDAGPAYLVCVDIDGDEALELAEQHLPPTRAMEGRSGKPNSHRWYWVTDVPTTAESGAPQVSDAATREGQFAGPLKKQFRHAASGSVLIDFIGSGGQAVVPPSYHEKSQTYRAWAGGNAIDKAAVVRFDDLWEAVNTLAVAAGGKRVALPSPKEAGGSSAKPEPKQNTIGKRIRPTRGGGRGEYLAPGNWQDTSLADRAEQCRRYIAAIPEEDLPRSGQGGHDRTYRLAKIIANDCALYEDRQLCLDLLREVNGQLRQFDDEWADGELAHKVDDAIRNAGTDPNYPIGCKLAGGRKATELPREWDNPDRLAGEFLADHTVKFVKDTAFWYDGRSYRVVTREWLRGQVHTFGEWQAEQEYARRQTEWDREHAPRIAELQQRAAVIREDTTRPLADVAREQAAIDKQINLAKRGQPHAVPKVSPALVAAVIEKVQARSQLDDNDALNHWVTSGNSPPRVVAAGNGLLDLDTNTLYPHTPDWFSTVCLPVEYDPSAPSPVRFLNFLNEVMEGDADRVKVLQEILGGTLDLGGPGKWFAALVGGGDNGKSVFLAVLRAVLGAGNVSAVNLDDLTGNRFASFSMFGKLANLIGDQGYVVSRDEGRLKSLTGGDLVSFEQKGRDPIFAVNTAKIIFAANALPSFGDKTDATWNRLVAVPFNFRVPDGRKNPNMLHAGHWADELPGILNWALEGLARLRSQGGFTRAAACEALKHDHRLDSDSARRFLAEIVEFTGREEDGLAVPVLYTAYRKWCESDGVKEPMGKPKFGSVVRAVYPGIDQRNRTSKTTRKKDRTWIGLRVRNEEVPPWLSDMIDEDA